MKYRFSIKLLSLIMAAIMTISIIPAAFAEEIPTDGGTTVTEPDSGQTEQQPVEQPTEEPTEIPASDSGDTPDPSVPDSEGQSEITDEPEEEWIGMEWLNKTIVDGEEWFGVIPNPNDDDEEESKIDPKTGSDPTADVETAEDWEQTIPYSKLNGSKAHDLITVALSQMGYHESTKNYVLNERGKHKGYSRYGQWYGIPYGDWCAMFVSFCLNYAGIKSSSFPRSASCTAWMNALRSMKKLAEPGYDPNPGDLIFFRFWQSSGADHVGIVHSTYTDANGVKRVKVIEGNSSDRVQYMTYPISSSRIAGYGLLTDTYGPDFSSKRLLAITSDQSILKKGTIIGQYGNAYLLSFDTASAAEAAFDYYSGKIDAVAPDVRLSAAEGDDNNALVLLNELFRVKADELLEQATNDPDSLTATQDDRPLIAVIDTAVTDPNVEQYSVINPIPEAPSATESEPVVKPSEIVADGEQDVIIPPADSEEEIVEIEPTHGDRMMAYIREENPDARVISIEALDGDGRGTAASVYAAMRLAMSKGARVINLSLSAYSTDTNAVLASVINDAAGLGITVVVSAGNSGKNAKFFTPANVGSAVTVGSCDKDGDALGKSNYGDAVDYYIVSDSTSEAAARFTGIISKSAALPDYGEQVRQMMNYRIFVEKKFVDDTVPPIPNENEDGEVAAQYPTFSTNDTAHGVCGTCSWLIDRGGNLVIWPTSGDVGVLTDMFDSASVPWYGYGGKVYTVRFMGTVKTRKGCVSLFADMANLTDIDFTGLDMSDAENISYMFSVDAKLKAIDLSKTNCGANGLGADGMKDMLKGCAGLKYIDLSGLNTGKVTSLHGLFAGCVNAQEIVMSNMPNPNVTDMSGLFSGLTKLKTVNLSGFSTENVTNMVGMFENCHSMTDIDLSGFNTEKCADFSGMFRNCAGIHELNLTGFTTNKEHRDSIKVDGMFAGCDGLVKLDISSDGFYMPNSGDTGLSDCLGLEEIVIGGGAVGCVTLPDGLWRHVDTDSTVSAADHGGTYQRISAISPDFDNLPDVNISISDLSTILPAFAQKGKKYTFTAKSDTDFEVITASAATVGALYSGDTDSFTLTYPNAAESVYGDKYDVVITFNNVKFNIADKNLTMNRTVASGENGLTLSGGVECSVTVKLVNKNTKAASAKKAWNKSKTDKIGDSAVWSKDGKGKYLTPESGTYLFGVGCAVGDSFRLVSGFTAGGKSGNTTVTGTGANMDFTAQANADSASFVWSSKSENGTSIFGGFSLKLLDVAAVAPDGEPLSGVSLQIQKGTVNPDSGEITYTDLQKSDTAWVSGDTAHNVALVPGEYRLIALSAPKSYGIVEPLRFSVSMLGRLVISGQGAARSLSVTVPVAESNIQLSLTDSKDTAKPLSGASFHLVGTSDSGVEIGITAATGTDGICDLGSVPVGTYTLTETAPKGYVQPDQPWSVTISQYDYTRLTDSQGIGLEGTFADSIHGVFSLKNEKETYSLTVKSSLKYGLPDDNDSFDFTLTLTDTAGNPVIVPTEKINGEISYDADGVYKLTVKAGTDGIKIPLPENTQYTVTEALSDNYTGCTVTKTVDGVSSALQTQRVNGTLKAENHVLNYTNIAKTVTVNVINTWDAMGHENLTPPESVTVQLLADGTETGQIAVLTEAEGWSHEFRNMPMYRNDNAIEYTVEEAEVTGWSVLAEYSTEQENQTITVTNVPTGKLTVSGGAVTDMTLMLEKSDGSACKLSRAELNANPKLTENADKSGYTLNIEENESVTLNLPQTVKYNLTAKNTANETSAVSGMIGEENVTVNADSFQVEDALTPAITVEMLSTESTDSPNRAVNAVMFMLSLTAVCAVVYYLLKKEKTK